MILPEVAHSLPCLMSPLVFLRAFCHNDITCWAPSSTYSDVETFSKFIDYIRCVSYNCLSCAINFHEKYSKSKVLVACNRINLFLQFPIVLTNSVKERLIIMSPCPGNGRPRTVPFWRCKNATEVSIMETFAYHNIFGILNIAGNCLFSNREGLGTSL